MDSSSAPSAPLSLGIDTGGTYTDAVLFSETAGVVAKAKALTTRHDLAEGIAGAVGSVMQEAGVDPARIGLVSMSTTLATNALVEGQGGRVGLIMIGFEDADLERDGLRAALGADPVLFLPGGHDVHGNETPLVLDALKAQLPALAGTVTAFAVCAYFAVRNPAHELAVADLLRQETGLPVTSSHELTSKLGGPRRALTTLLNARLVGLIDRLIAATQDFLDRHGIAAPLMMVRGDGALVSAAFARLRPIETILSGPAASLVGARHLTGLENAVVSDIGGTTTDVAVLEAGRPRIDPEGATVGGYRTMVEAVAMRTFGLGGDSEVTLDQRSLIPLLKLGPRRLVPLALCAYLHGETISRELERQLLSPTAGRLDGRFAFRTGVPERFAAGLTHSAEKFYAQLGDKPAALDRLIASNAQMATLKRLVARGLVHISGFTPSDAAHVLGKQANWDCNAARLGATLFARRRDGKGIPLAASPEEMAELVLARVGRCSAEAVLETVFAEDGFDGPETVSHPIMKASLDGRQGLTRMALTLDRPVVGLGASAGLHYSGLQRYFGAPCLVPAESDVANALGAVVGHVRIAISATVSQPKRGLFRVSSSAGLNDFETEDEAMAFAERELRRAAIDRSAEAGAGEVEVVIDREIRAADIRGERLFVEAIVTATASGRPRNAR